MSKILPIVLSIFLRFSISILLIGALFKIQHWPYDSVLLILGTAGILFFYSILFLLKKEKKRLDYVKEALVVLWCLNYGYQALHLYNLSIVFNIILLILFGWWFINEGTNYFSKSHFKVGGAGKIVFIIFVIIAIGFIVLGMLFKILHWPYGILLFTLGILLASFLVIIDYFVRAK